MKPTHAPIFNMEVSPPQVLPGFQLFQAKGSREYCFCCSDVNGQAFLFSPAFQSKEAANTAMRSALRNASKEKQYQKHSESGHHYFTLLSGNQQELARSCNYLTTKEMELAIAYLRQVAVAQQPVVPIASPELPAKKTGQASPIVNKHAFRIDFYAAEKGGKWTGRIEHLTTGENMALEGVQTEAISSFLLTRMPSRNNPNSFLESSPENARLELLQSPWSETPNNKSLVNLQLVLAAGASTDAENWMVHVSAHQIGGKHRMELSFKPARVSNRGDISIELPSAYFVPGLYRIEAQVVLGQYQDKPIYTGTCLLQAY